MWPFDHGDRTSVWLLVYLVTWALHFVFVGYVLIGAAYALVRSGDDDPIAAQVRDRAPFMLGCGITAGVAPLLMLQLLYQRHFYAANLVLGPRWGAVVPALIVGFYALYVAKDSARWRRLALATAALCFLFVAWSWAEIHQLARDEPAWVRMYAAGERLYGDASVAPRLVLWLGVMAVLFATTAAWWVAGAARRRLAAIAFGGLGVGGAGAAWIAASGGAIAAPAIAWLGALIAGIAATVTGWLLTWRRADGRGLLLSTCGAAGSLLAGAVIREAPRLALVEPVRPAAADASGLWLFATTLAFGIAAIAWVIRTVRR